MVERLFRRPIFGFSNFEMALLVIVIMVLSSLVVISSSAVEQKNRDTTRKNHILALEEQVNSYQASTGKYPTAAELNDPAFTKKNLPNFEASALRDPSWKSTSSNCTSNNQPQLSPSTAPVRGCIGYAASPIDCDNQDVDCTSYTLSVKLEAGGYFIRTSTD